MFFINIPIYDNYTRVVYYPTSDHANGGKLLLYTKEMRPLKPTGSFISVPYHYGYEYAVFAAFDTGVVTAVFNDFPPEAIKYFKYKTEFPEKPEVMTGIYVYLSIDNFFLGHMHF